MRPEVTIIIATFNSEKTLPRVLGSIKRQTYHQKKIEIILVDGGSTDKTLEIGRKFDCKIIKNPRTEPLYGKFLGYLNAKGKYAVYLDSDEAIENKESIALKIKAFRVDDNVKAVVGSGYKSPKGYHFVNTYINEFGDPFSFFIYRLSKDLRFFLKTMKKRYSVFYENGDFVVITFKKGKVLPIIELGAGGSMFEIDFFKKNFPKTKKNPSLLPLLFYLLYSKYAYLAITKKDPLIHYSSDTLKKYLKKIEWRIKNNIHHVKYVGMSGFTGRDRYQPKIYRLKKFLFIPYSFSIIFPILDSVYLALTRKNLGYFLHVFLTFYAAFLILYHYFLKILGVKPALGSYGESKTAGS